MVEFHAMIPLDQLEIREGILISWQMEFEFHPGRNPKHHLSKGFGLIENSGPGNKGSVGDGSMDSQQQQ